MRLLLLLLALLGPAAAQQTGLSPTLVTATRSRLAEDGTGTVTTQVARAWTHLAEDPTPWTAWALALDLYRQAPEDREVRWLVAALGLHSGRHDAVQPVADALYAELSLAREVCGAARDAAAGEAERAVATTECGQVDALWRALEAARIETAQPQRITESGRSTAHWYGAPAPLGRLIPRVLGGRAELSPAERRQHRRDLRWLDAAVGAHEAPEADGPSLSR